MTLAEDRRRGTERKPRPVVATYAADPYTWALQPERRTRSLEPSVAEHRRRVTEHLEDGPGLRSMLPTLLGRAYADRRGYALAETELAKSLLPETCPSSWDEIMTRPVEWAEDR